jgi:hypothetical protein
MSHEAKLNVYKITLLTPGKNLINTNKWLFRNIIKEANTTPLADSFIYTEIFKKFISTLDTPEMYADSASKRCMTAHQRDIDKDDVNVNIKLHSEDCIIEGKVEGGKYGKRRNKISILDKSNKSLVDEKDAIAEDFYFLLYSPFHSDKSILMVQSYSDDSIDSVMKKFWQSFFAFPRMFKKPSIDRFFPQSIIEDFKNSATVNSLTFSTEVPGANFIK